MMRKKETYTNVTPIPSNIPRQLAVEILHSHGEIITLNPLVTGYQPIKAPRDAKAEEYYSTWYEIEERIQFVPGMGRLGSGRISFRGCFHDMPWGLQTHIYAPMNVDLRNTWRIAGNQPGEPREIPELGINAPAEGLYLREDVEIKCNVTMVSFVKKETKAASKALVDRLIRKAELLDAGVLLAMMEDGRLKTINPADRSNTMSSYHTASPNSPTTYAPTLVSPKFPQRMSLPFLTPVKGSPNSGPGGPGGHAGAGVGYGAYQPNSPPAANAQEFRSELPGNEQYLPLDAKHRPASTNVVSELPATNKTGWSNSQPDYKPYQQNNSGQSRPNSTSAAAAAADGARARYDHQRQSNELPTVAESRSYR